MASASSPVVSAAPVVLHVPQGVTFEEYLVRVLLYLGALVAVAVITFGNIRMIGIIRSAIDQER